MLCGFHIAPVSHSSLSLSQGVCSGPSPPQAVNALVFPSPEPLGP